MIVTTCGVKALMDSDILFRVGVQQCLINHVNGDWGKLRENDKKLNDEALKAEKEGRMTDSLFSSYSIDGTEIYVITEWDRSVTTVLLPEEY
jgi:hypothetical protein